MQTTEFARDLLMTSTQEYMRILKTRIREQKSGERIDCEEERREMENKAGIVDNESH